MFDVLMVLLLCVVPCGLMIRAAIGVHRQCLFSGHFETVLAARRRVFFDGRE
jgi:hypothetical protein